MLLDNVTFFPGESIRLEILRDNDLSSGSDGFAVGATSPDSFGVFRCGTDKPIKVTLVWTDPPVAATSGQAWINDLNLEVVAPGGATYLGNVFSNGISATERRRRDLPGSGGSSQRDRRAPAVRPAGHGRGLDAAVPPTDRCGHFPNRRLRRRCVSRQRETLNPLFNVQNEGCGDADPVDASLHVGPGSQVSITPSSVLIPGIPAGEAADVAFRLSLDGTGEACGAEVPLRLRLQVAGGPRWEHAEVQQLELDPSQGDRTVLDEVESGDRSIEKSSAWQINSCVFSSPTQSWHLGDPDCSGIPRDASVHSLVLPVDLAPGENLDTASFNHAFNGYSNSTLTDSIHFEIDHDLDGTYDSIASWNDDQSEIQLSAAGPFDLSPFNIGRSSTVNFRFRFQSGAVWAGPNNAAGWNVDDFRVRVRIDAACDVQSSLPPGDVGPTLVVGSSDPDVSLSWGFVSDADSYRIFRSATPDFAVVEESSSATPLFYDGGALEDGQTHFYRVLAANACGLTSAD